MSFRGLITPWELFERAAPGYDGWYDTPRGQRVERAERALLSDLLAMFPGAESLLEIGCGTGRFSAWSAGAFRVLGIDRSPAMLAEMRARHTMIPVLLADAHRLPLPAAAVDVALFVTALEFLEDPLTALGEAVRVARRGVILIVLNRWSAGGLSRRVGAQSRSPVLGQARDLSLLSLRAMMMEAAGCRVIALSWASALLPAGLWAVRGKLPLGDVLGMALVLAEPSRGRASQVAAVDRLGFVADHLHGRRPGDACPLQVPDGRPPEVVRDPMWHPGGGAGGRLQPDE